MSLAMSTVAAFAIFGLWRRFARDAILGSEIYARHAEIDSGCLTRGMRREEQHR